MKFTQSEINSVTRTIKSGWLTTGNISHQLEDKFCRYVGAKYGAAVGSCTAGLQLALKVLGISGGDEVITTPYTFVASTEAILHCGARPVFEDIDPVTLNMDPDQIEKKITSKTRAIVPVHIAGLPCRLDKITKIARKHKLFVVNDSAHAIGAEFKGKKIGAYGDLSSFSFYATKNLTTAEGGIVTTNNAKLADEIRVLSLHGMDKKAWKRYLDQGSWYYEVVSLGYKYNLADMNAALGLAMMDRLDILQEKRRRIASWYDQALSKFDEIELPAREEDSKHAWHLYIIKLNLDKLKIGRDQFIKELTECGVGTSVHFIPLFLQPFYKGKYGLQQKHFPAAMNAFERVISLPFYPDLRKAEVIFVADAVGKIISKHRKL
jgi:dTDP-4-amino-4,6-dideoxygalactose transaminase